MASQFQQPLGLMTRILADSHQIEIRLNLTLGTKTLNVARVLDRAKISISTHFNGFYKGGVE
jgi:hypothetical protein